ncbi:MAG: cyclic-di-AMP receptor [Clostridia bacterium]|nr:cyclic-di-AMP receptor [Clostridia bacterium]
MKLVIAIVHDEDSTSAMQALNAEGFSVTKLATTGGFLKSGNTTLLIGTDQSNVQRVIDIIKSQSETRKRVVSPPVPLSMNGGMEAYPIEIDVGGATVFVVDVERFEKI